jgi:hypothetical protein
VQGGWSVWVVQGAGVLGVCLDADALPPARECAEGLGLGALLLETVVQWRPVVVY